jgi:hypothetical protein
MDKMMMLVWLRCYHSMTSRLNRTVGTGTAQLRYLQTKEKKNQLIMFLHAMSITGRHKKPR